MNSGHDSEQQRFKDAGEQAARVVNEFVSIASDFSKQLEKGFCSESKGKARKYNPSPGSAKPEFDANGSRASSTGADDSNTEEQWRKAGEYLRELRDAAGYTVDGFARAINRDGAAETIRSVEGGRDVFPEEWLDQVSTVLKQSDPLDFLAKLRSLYDEESNPASDTEVDVSSTVAQAINNNPVSEQRRQKLAGILSDQQLEGLSDDQFAELYKFVEINCQSALQLVRNK